VKIAMSKKYHMLHSTISFRCRSIEEYTNIKEMVKRSGKSESDYVREIILGAEAKESQSFEARRKQELNKFYLPCFICKKDMCFDLTINEKSTTKNF
jgi:predicted DNA-binding protein